MSAPAGLQLSPIGREALDDPATDPALVTRMLQDIARSNRWLGGAGAMRFGLRHLIDEGDRGRVLSLLDIGTGAGDLPLAAMKWATRHGVRLQAVGLERLRPAARMARNAGLPVMLACAGALPFARRSVDIVLVSQVLHHLDEKSAVELLAGAGALARRGVIVADLNPRWFAGPGFRLVGRALGMHPVTLDDGVTSLRRGFGTGRLAELCRAAGITHAQVAARPLARVVAWWKTAAT